MSDTKRKNTFNDSEADSQTNLCSKMSDKKRKNTFDDSEANSQTNLFSEMPDKKRKNTSDDFEADSQTNLKDKNPIEHMTIELCEEEEEFMELYKENQTLVMENILLKEKVKPLICSNCKMMDDLLAQNFRLKQENKRIFTLLMQEITKDKDSKRP